MWYGRTATFDAQNQRKKKEAKEKEGEQKTRAAVFYRWWV